MRWPSSEKSPATRDTTGPSALNVMEPPQWWPTMDYRPMKGIQAGCGLTRDEARRLLEAMLRDVDEMPGLGAMTVTLTA